MKSVLYISYDGLTDPLGQSQVLPYLVELTKCGYRFTILSFEKKGRYEKEKHIINAIVKKAGIIWQPLFFTKNPPILSKAYDRWQMKRNALKLYNKNKFDLIHCRSYIAAEVGLWLKQKFRTKFLFDMRGFWADEKVDNGQWNINNPVFKKIYKHYKTKEKEFLLNADSIVSLTNAAKTELHKNSAYSNLQIDVIPCCADLNHFSYERVTADTTSKLKDELRISKKNKVLLYLGSIGGWYMTKEMFSYFRCLLDLYPEFVMLILTKDEPASVIKEAEESGIPGTKIIVRYSPRTILPDYMSVADCSIFFIRPTFSKIASSPTKHAELMGMGIPVICNDIGDTGRIIEKTNTGIIIRDFTAQEYELMVSKTEQLLTVQKQKIRKYAFEYFDLHYGVEAYRQVYKQALGEFNFSKAV